MLSLQKGKKNYYTIKFNNKYIHSKYDPIKEAEVFINKYNKLLKNKTVVVYGLGLGYHIDNILSKVDENTNIIIFEWSKEVVKLCKNVNPKLFQKDNIRIFTESNDFYSLLAQYLKSVDDIIIYKPCLEIIKEVNCELYNLINEYNLNRDSIEKNQQLLVNNYKSNIKSNNKDIKELIRTYECVHKPYVIVAAGPSLDYDIEMLKKFREKFVIISVGSALMTLTNAEIIPDIITIIDGQQVVANQFNGFNRDDIPLCFLSTASRWVVNNYKGPKYIFFNDESDSELVIETGKTVAVAAINIGLKCGAKEVIFLGQDLAYINKKTHSYTYEHMYKEKDTININHKTPTVESYDRKIIYTSKAYLYYKKQIEKIINKNNSIKFINCSKGAFIKGAIHMNFKKYIQNN